MIRDWWQEQTGIRAVCGLEVLLHPNAERSYQICSLKLIKNAVSVIHQADHSDLNKALEKLKNKKAPLAINFSGEGVISKIIPIPQSGKAIDQAFPGMDQDKFYIQEIHQKSTVIISLINKKLADEILELLKEQEILNISLAGFVPSVLKKQTDQTGETFTFGPHQLNWNEDGEIGAYIYSNETGNEKNIRFAGIKVKGIFFNAFSQAFQLFFYPQLQPIGIAQDQKGLSVFYKAIKIKLTAIVLLVFIFFILMVNFLLWTSFNREKQNLESQAAFNRGMVSDRDSLVSTIDKKEKQLKDFGLLPVSHQRLIYEIGKAVPSGIKLTAIEINPEQEDGIGYGKITIKGEMKDVKAYEEFKSNLMLSDFNFIVIGESFNHNKNAGDVLWIIEVKFSEE